MHLETVRQTYQEDLARICDLLLPANPDSNMEATRRKAQQRSQQRIDQAYADLKAELIEQARVRKQQALEKALAEKRCCRAAYAAHYRQMKNSKQQQN